MPELPEVETVCRGIQAVLTNARCKQVIIRQPTLRWPVPDQIKTNLPGSVIKTIYRRAKYLVIETTQGALIIHLGMTGYLRLHSTLPAAEKHDHVDFVFETISLRFSDPRRFGAILWSEGSPDTHPLLQNLAIEPLTKAFNPSYFHSQLLPRRTSIKTCLMNGKIVAGIGNIYANEALFLSRIHPEQPASTLSPQQATTLCHSIKLTLQKAIKAGGTTFKDFQASDGKPGYFKQQLMVYGRENQPCVRCQTTLKKAMTGQRSSVFCEICQALW